MPLQQDAKKMTNQKMLVKSITEYITVMLGDNDIAKQYMKALTGSDAQKSLNRLGQTHADIKKKMEAVPAGDEHKAKEEDVVVVQTITQMLTAYNHSQKNEEVALGIINGMLTDAKSQAGTPSQPQPQKPEAAAKTTPAPGAKR